MENQKNQVYTQEAEIKEYQEKIIGSINNICDIWILNVIHNFIEGMVKEGD